VRHGDRDELLRTYVQGSIGEYPPAELAKSLLDVRCELSPPS
jgi:hypothetical protein